MKRKFKLITTIASLTAAIALLMFGVYAAATTRTVDIAGTVSFQAKNVDATVAISQGRGLTAVATYSPYLITNAGEEDQAVDGAWVFSTGAEAKQDGKEVSGLGLLLDDDNLVYSYKIVVSATGASEVHGRYTLSDVAYPDGVSLTSISVDGVLLDAGDLTEDFVIEAETNVAIVVVYTLVPSELVLSGAEMDFDIVAHVKLATTSANLDI